MPWCPKCKNEYREGVTVCADCGCELVEEEQFAHLSSVTFGDREQLEELKKYLEFNKIQGVTIQFDEEDKVYELLVREEDRQKAVSMTRVFLKESQNREAKEEQAETDVGGETELSEAEETATDKQEESCFDGLYLNSSTRAEENRSSAWTLLLVGAVGMVFVILGIAGVLPIHVGNTYMFYGVMSAVFILFLVMGVVSMKNAKIFARKAESENTLKDTMIQWYRENLTADLVDAEIEDVQNTSDELLYFKRVQKLKEKFNNQFMNLDQAFLEHFIDDEVYEHVFPGEEDKE